MADFFRMSGYAFYVWPAYALAIGALLFNVWGARRSFASARSAARRRAAIRDTAP